MSKQASTLVPICLENQFECISLKKIVTRMSPGNVFERQQLSGDAAAAAAVERKNNTLASAELHWGQTGSVWRGMRADCASVHASGCKNSVERASAELGSH